jgi:hypothetical protein
MSDAPGVGGSPTNELQFDRVEYAETGAACGACGQPMRGVYYEVNGLAVCQVCREQLEASLNSGSPLGRFARATLFGALAGLVGAAIYYGVRETTNIEFGLISVVVGLMIGKAVKAGSKGRGGWMYQSLAMFLTYMAIVFTYIPLMVHAVQDRRDQKAAAEAQPPAKAAAVEGVGDAEAKPTPSVPGLLFALVLVAGFAYAIPVLVGFQSPMSLIIVGIGLYEAWVINRRVPLLINGPFQIGPADGGRTADVDPVG